MEGFTKGIADAETQPTGIGWLVGAPGSAADWVAELLITAIIAGAAALGSMLLGLAGAAIGGVPGVAASAAVAWK